MFYYVSLFIYSINVLIPILIWKTDTSLMPETKSVYGVTRKGRYMNKEGRPSGCVKEKTIYKVDRNVLNWFLHVEHISGKSLAKRVKTEVQFYIRWHDEVKNVCSARSLQVKDTKVKLTDIEGALWKVEKAVKLHKVWPSILLKRNSEWVDSNIAARTAI